MPAVRASDFLSWIVPGGVEQACPGSPRRAGFARVGVVEACGTAAKIAASAAEVNAPTGATEMHFLRSHSATAFPPIS